jgi:MFS family permease
LVSTGAFSLLSLGCALAPSLPVLLVLRGLQSIASGGIGAVGIPLLLSCTSPAMRGRMLGYSVTAVYLGLSLGPVIGGVMNSVFGWRSIFLLACLLPAVSLALGLKFIEREDGSAHADFDVWGNVLYVLMIAALLLGLSLWNNGWWAKALVVLGVALLGCFIAVELRSDHPAVQVRLFARDAGYSLSNAAALMNYGATFAISYTLSLYLQNVAGLPSSLAGIVLICQPGVQTLVSPFAGRLSDRIAPYKLASAGMGIIAVGLFLLSGITASTPLVQVVGYLVLVGFGFGLFSSPNTNAVLSCVDKKHLGEANAILSTMRSLGMSISMVIVLAVFGSVVGNVVVSDAPVDSLVAAIHTAMLIFGCICVVGTGISLVRRRAKQA